MLEGLPVGRGRQIGDRFGGLRDLRGRFGLKVDKGEIRK